MPHKEGAHNHTHETASRLLEKSKTHPNQHVKFAMERTAHKMMIEAAGNDSKKSSTSRAHHVIASNKAFDHAHNEAVAAGNSVNAATAKAHAVTAHAAASVHHAMLSDRINEAAEHHDAGDMHSKKLALDAAIGQHQKIAKEHALKRVAASDEGKHNEAAFHAEEEKQHNEKAETLNHHLADSSDNGKLREIAKEHGRLAEQHAASADSAVENRKHDRIRTDVAALLPHAVNPSDHIRIIGDSSEFTASMDHHKNTDDPEQHGVLHAAPSHIDVPHAPAAPPPQNVTEHIDVPHAPAAASHQNVAAHIDVPPAPVQSDPATASPTPNQSNPEEKMPQRRTYWGAAKSAANSVSGALDRITENATIQNGAVIGHSAAKKGVALAHSLVMTPTAAVTGFAGALQNEFSEMATGISSTMNYSNSTSSIGTFPSHVMRVSRQTIPVAAVAAPTAMVASIASKAADVTTDSDDWSDSD